MKKLIVVLALVVIAGCTDADIASHNISKSAEMFEINRRIVFYNGITNDYILSVEGLCSVDLEHNYNQLQLTCKTGPQSYKKHFY